MKIELATELLHKYLKHAVVHSFIYCSHIPHSDNAMLCPTNSCTTFVIRRQLQQGDESEQSS